MTLSKNICLCCLSQKCKAARSGTRMELQPCQEAFKLRQKVYSTSQWQLTNQEGTHWFKHTSPCWEARQTHSAIQPHLKCNFWMSDCHVADGTSRERRSQTPLCHRAKLHSIFLACWTKTLTNILAEAPNINKSSQRETFYSFPSPCALLVLE